MTESFDSAASVADPVPFPVGTRVNYASWREGIQIHGVVAEVMEGRLRAITVKHGAPNIVLHTDALTLADPPRRDPAVLADLDGEQRTDAPDPAEIDRRVLARLMDDVDRLSAALAEAEMRPTREDMAAVMGAMEAIKTANESLSKEVAATSLRIAAARREGAEAMRARCVKVCNGIAFDQRRLVDGFSRERALDLAAAAIRAEPLP